MKRFLTPLLLSTVLATAACAQEPAADTADMAATDTAMVEPVGDIVAVAQGNPDFSTLVTAVTAAGLGETLQGAGPFTVFAPTNAAFAALPEGTVDTLVMPENKEQLADILTYHVVAGETMAAALVEAIAAGGGKVELTTVNGAVLTAATTPEGGVTLTDAAGNTANVTMTDVDASNGVIHVIDKVLMPS